VLDTIGNPNISFDDQGVCNYCYDYDRSWLSRRLAPEVARQKLEALVEEIKSAGKTQKYDSILGLSGGMDSSYIAYLAKEYGLRPLAVHLDNGWDAELAVKNIENILHKTGFDYYNYVVDWDEFRSLQLAYLKASVIDTEVVTDQAIFALLHIVARKWHIRYILIGENPATEGIMPKGWNFHKNDLANLMAIYRRFGTIKLRTYPLMGQYDLKFYRTVLGIRYAALLHFIVPYDLKTVRETLEKEFDWRDYEWKHCESIFTKFYQGYILPTKFQIDKRKVHLSDMIRSGLITREAALSQLERHYYDEVTLKIDYDFVLRKFGLTQSEFRSLMDLTPVPHESFPQDTLGTWDWAKLSLLELLHHPRFTLWRELAKLRGFVSQQRNKKTNRPS
jgi:N-acetyl sugar amidotransferase